MRGHVVDQGHYELFESKRAHMLLMLNEKNWYRWQWDAAIQKLYKTVGIIEKSGDIDYNIQLQGLFYIVESDQGEFTGSLFLLLENKTYFNVYRLPEGLPNDMDIEAEIVDEKEKVLLEELDTSILRSRV